MSSNRRAWNLPPKGAEAQPPVPKDQGHISTAYHTNLVFAQKSLNHAEEMLESSGYKVLLAENGIEAADIYEKRGRDIGLVILDMVQVAVSAKMRHAAPTALDSRFEGRISRSA